MEKVIRTLVLLLLSAVWQAAEAQQRRPIDSEHPLWMIHIDVWYAADPQKIIDLVPDDIKPYVCMNLSLSCQYDTEKNVYKMPQQAVRTYKSWASVCQANGLWFTCQPASGGHTHIQDDDLETFEYFFRRYPNFLGWNYAEQFWGFDAAGDKSSGTQASRWALFAKLVEMSHRYGGFLTVSFCGNIWSHGLNPVGEMKRDKNLLEACRKYPEAILWLYKYTTSSCFYNNESVTLSPFISGLANNYGVRYDNCGWNSALDQLLGENHGRKYPASAGIGTVMEQTGINGGAVWDGPELTWREECFHEVAATDADGYKCRNWAQYPNFKGVWADMFRKVIDGTLRIPSRKEVVDRTKIVVVNDITAGSDEQKYAAWGSLYDGLYKQDDPFNRGNGQWMDNFSYMKRTGRYAAIPVCLELYDDLAKSIPVQVKKSEYARRWPTQESKVADFDSQYPAVSEGDLFVARMGNQLVTYTPYSYLNSKVSAEATVPLEYNTCGQLQLCYGKLSAGIVREYADRIDFYLNNYRTDTTALVTDRIVITGASAQPAFTAAPRGDAQVVVTPAWDAATATYTLDVAHIGPVDLSVACSGSVPRTAEAPYATALELPRQPVAYHGPVIIEAEDMDYKNIRACTTSPYYQYPDVIGHSGNGFVDMGVGKGGSLRHQLTLKEGGPYCIGIRYTCTTKPGRLTAVVNGISYSVATEQTAVNEWRKATLDADLKAGTNDLRLNNVAGLPMYIDQIIYTPAGMEPEKFLVTVRGAEHGSVVAGTGEAAEGDTVTLTVNPEEGYQLKELRVVSSVYYTLSQTIAFTPGSGKVTFVMPDDNVTLQPVFADVTSVYKLDFSAITAGGMPEGWRCVQENGEVHEYPGSYGLGSRTLAGFTGYQGKGLYWREECAEYGRQDAYPLQLEAGDYKLSFAVAAWKGSPKYKVKVLDAVSGSTVAASAVYTAAPDASGNTSAVLTSAQTVGLPFTVAAAGRYVISFTNESLTGGYEEYLVLECRVNTAADATGIAPVLTSGSGTPGIYGLSGVRRTEIGRGLNIVRDSGGKVRKVFRK